MLHKTQKKLITRHIGPSEDDQKKMLSELQYSSLDDLRKNTV